MKYIYATILAFFSSIGSGYDTLAPQNYGQVVVLHPPQVTTQIMVYHAPYFTVTVPVPITVPVAVAQPIQHTVYWGYPYQPIVVNNYGSYRCRPFNFNY